jgi:hypothetical protein
LLPTWSRRRTKFEQPEFAEVTLETLALVSQIAAAAAVFASLIFVGLQIREQANATRAQTEQAIAANWVGIGWMMAEGGEAVAAGVVSESSTLADLSEGDRMRFFSAMFAFFKHYENMYLQREKGRIGEAEWGPWSNHVRTFFHQPGVQSWWAIRKLSFAPSFRDFLDGSTEPAEVQFAEFRDLRT